ncbi:DUF4328 domain-containing protein [Streptomyces sp. H27-C3]|uniref:DUF4328 domain-containing protein n=1 Tax=Streptomyces sp. H27-C3 TaxID=3046305 RepID=UPI0024BAB860|nr:DUF4328 domain-containing protein [Streptomyces sp. H27-C3]MDJ0464088.1 DUF4328 domain-containing protein [Streptomyces sp. H27-C3]
MTVPRSPVGLSYAVVALLGTVIVTDVFSILVSLRVRSLMDDVISGNFVSDAALDGVDSLRRVSMPLFYVTAVACAVVFVVWFFRVRRNAGIFAPDLQRRGAGWAIGAWFIPIGNLWLPRGIAADILAASRQDPYGLGRSKGESGTVLDAWWTMWVVSLLFNRWFSVGHGRAETAAGLRAAADMVIIGDLINITAAVFAILFVRMLTRMQQFKAAPLPAERPVLN